MTKLTVCVLLILGAVVLFPPADRMKSVGGEEMLFKEGYTFIAKTGGPVRIRFEEWSWGIGIAAVVSVIVAFSGPIRSRITPLTRRVILRIIAPLLILGPIVCLAFVVLFAWAWTESTTWGAWSKGPQTQSEHINAFLSFMLRFYWVQILTSAVMVAIGIYIWPRRLAYSGSKPNKARMDNPH